jgi:hypothetical protein
VADRTDQAVVNSIFDQIGTLSTWGGALLRVGLCQVKLLRNRELAQPYSNQWAEPHAVMSPQASFLGH